MAQDSGSLSSAGLAALTLIEEHGATWRVAESELPKVYQRANELLRDTQDAEDIKRLRACALIVIKRLSGMQLGDRNFSFYGAVHELEARLIERALELEAGSVTRAAERLGLKRQSLSLAFSPDGRQLATASYDRAVRLWNLSDGTLARTLEGHEGTVWSVAFSHDGGRLASGGEDKTVRLTCARRGAAGSEPAL